MRFKPEQKVICIIPQGESWCNNEGVVPGIGGYGPEHREIVTVDHYSDLYPDGVCFIEYPRVDNGERYYFADCWFEPLCDISELTAILESEPVHQTI
jgi:hypothetical protein